MLCQNSSRLVLTACTRLVKPSHGRRCLSTGTSTSGTYQRFGRLLGVGGCASVAAMTTAWCWTDGQDDNFKSELINTYLNLEQLDNNLFRAQHLIVGLRTNPTVFGGQVMGQALMAANNTTPEEFVAHSFSCYFILPGRPEKPILYQVERIRDGRSYANRSVKGIQNGQPIFTADISFHKDEKPAIVHQMAMPAVPEPESLRNTHQLLSGLVNDDKQPEPMRKWWQFRLENVPSTIEMRPCNSDEYLNLKHSQPKIAMWVRTKQRIGDDHRLHFCVAAFISDYLMLSTAIMPHINHGYRMGMVTTLSHCMWIHKKQFRMDDWMLFETESTVADGGRALIHGRLWTRDGRLVVSTAQEGVVRSPRTK